MISKEIPLMLTGVAPTALVKKFMSGGRIEIMDIWVCIFKT